MEEIRKDLETKLEMTFSLNVHLEKSSLDCKLQILGSLLYLYDNSWQLDSLPLLFGKKFHDPITIDAATRKRNLISIKRWFHLLEIGHLVAKESLSSLCNNDKKFYHLLTNIIDKIEQHHGTQKLKASIRLMIQKQSRVSAMKYNSPICRPSTVHSHSKSYDNDKEHKHRSSSGNYIPKGVEIPRTPAQKSPPSRLDKTFEVSHDDTYNVQKLNRTFEITSDENINKEPINRETERKISSSFKSPPQIVITGEDEELPREKNKIPTGKQIPMTPLKTSSSDFVRKRPRSPIESHKYILDVPEDGLTHWEEASFTGTNPEFRDINVSVNSIDWKSTFPSSITEFPINEKTGDNEKTILTSSPKTEGKDLSQYEKDTKVDTSIPRSQKEDETDFTYITNDVVEQSSLDPAFKKDDVLGYNNDPRIKESTDVKNSTNAESDLTSLEKELCENLEANPDNVTKNLNVVKIKAKNSKSKSRNKFVSTKTSKKKSVVKCRNKEDDNSLKSNLDINYKVDSQSSPNNAENISETPSQEINDNEDVSKEDINKPYIEKETIFHVKELDDEAFDLKKRDKHVSDINHKKGGKKYKLCNAMKSSSNNVEESNAITSQQEEKQDQIEVEKCLLDYTKPDMHVTEVDEECSRRRGRRRNNKQVNYQEFFEESPSNPSVKESKRNHKHTENNSGEEKKEKSTRKVGARKNIKSKKGNLMTADSVKPDQEQTFDTDEENSIHNKNMEMNEKNEDTITKKKNSKSSAKSKKGGTSKLPDHPNTDSIVEKIQRKKIEKEKECKSEDGILTAISDNEDSKKRNPVKKKKSDKKDEEQDIDKENLSFRKKSANLRKDKALKAIQVVENPSSLRATRSSTRLKKS